MSFPESRRRSSGYNRVDTSAEHDGLLYDSNSILPPASDIGINVQANDDSWNAVPKKPLTAVLFACMPEGFGELILVPFIYSMVRDLKPDLSDGEVAFYVGLVGTCNFLPLFVTNIFAGALSDKLGRRRVMLCGCIGNGVGNLLFGLSYNIPMLLATRFFTGIWTFNSTIAKSVLGDISGPSTRGIVFGLYGTAFGAAALVAPIVGGALVHPADKMPQYFTQDSIFANFPYLLPFLLISVLSFFSSILCYYWMDDSLPGNKCQQLSSLEEKKKASANSLDLLYSEPNSKRRVSVVSIGSENVVLDVQSRPASPAFIAPRGSQEVDSVIELADGNSCAKERTLVKENDVFKAIFDFRGPNSIYTRSVVISVAIYMLLAFAYSLYYTLIAIWGAAQTEDGGLEYPPDKLSLLSSTYGLVKIVFQLLVFPKLVTRLGTSMTLRIGAILIIVNMFASSTLSAIPKESAGVQYAGALASSAVMAIADVFGYLSVIIMLTDAVAPEKLGLMHGVASTGAAAARMAGPALIGAIWSYGSSYNDGNQIASFASIALVSLVEFVLTLPYFL